MSISNWTFIILKYVLNITWSPSLKWLSAAKHWVMYRSATKSIVVDVAIFTLLYSSCLRIDLWHHWNFITAHNKLSVKHNTCRAIRFGKSENILFILGVCMENNKTSKYDGLWSCQHVGRMKLRSYELLVCRKHITTLWCLLVNTLTNDSKWLKLVKLYSEQLIRRITNFMIF